MAKQKQISKGTQQSPKNQIPSVTKKSGVNTKKKTSSRNIGYAIVIIIVFLIVGGLFFFSSSDEKEETRTSSPSETTSTRTVVEDGALRWTSLTLSKGKWTIYPYDLTDGYTLELDLRGMAIECQYFYQGVWSKTYAFGHKLNGKIVGPPNTGKKVKRSAVRYRSQKVQGIINVRLIKIKKDGK